MDSDTIPITHKCDVCGENAGGEFIPRFSKGPQAKVRLCWDCREELRNTQHDVILTAQVNSHIFESAADDSRVVHGA